MLAGFIKEQFYNAAISSTFILSQNSKNKLVTKILTAQVLSQVMMLIFRFPKNASGHLEIRLFNTLSYVNNMILSINDNYENLCICR